MSLYVPKFHFKINRGTPKKFFCQLSGSNFLFKTLLSVYVREVIRIGCLSCQNKARLFSSVIIDYVI